MKTTVHLVYLFLLLCAFGFAQDASQVSATQVVVPHLIRFSGTVQESGGGATVGITFTLHRSQQDETALWIETQNVHLDSTGEYTVLLGATKTEGIPTELFTSGEAQWLGIRVEGQPEQPRVLLVSVPYALKAAEADTLAGHAANEFVTTDKLSSAVQQQMQQQGPAASANEPGVRRSANKNSTPVDGATDFTDTTTNQVVLVTQNGTGAGLVATAGNNYALSGTSTNTAIYGSSTGAAHATAPALEGVTTSSQGRGIFGWANTTTGTNFGLYGQANSVSGTGIAAASTATTGTTVGLEAQDNSPTGTAAVIQNRGGGKIISGQTGATNTEVFSIAGTGSVAATSSAPGVASPSPTSLAAAILGHETNATGFTNGLAGIIDATSGSGVLGIVTASSSGSDAPSGVTGVAVATSGYTYGVMGEVLSVNGIAGDFRNDVSGTVLRARYGKPTATTVLSVGSTGFQIGVAGQPGSIDGNTNLNGNTVLNGNATVDGNLSVSGTISAGTKDFKIDHPLDPANKFLYHASVESSEMVNIYSGNATTDAGGRAVVQLPDWFEAENRDFRYQLTVLEQFAQAIVAKKISDHQFTIKTDRPNVEVSWQVTGVRQDAYAKAHPLEVEVDKSEREKGYYIHPELYGAALEKQIDGRGVRN